MSAGVAGFLIGVVAGGVVGIIAGAVVAVGKDSR